MRKINGKVSIFIVFLILVLLSGLFIKTLVDTRTPVQEQVNMQIPVKEAQAAGLFIEFEDGITEPEVKAILENCNMTVDYSIEYNVDYMPNRYYITVNKDKRTDIKDELSKEENWTDPVFPDIKKGNYYIITVTEQAIHDKNFITMLEKHNLQAKKSVYCYICLGNRSKNHILEENALRIKNELERNEKALTVFPEVQAAGLFIEFEDGTTEPEVKAILENYNMTMNYTIDYNSDLMLKRYYIIVDKDKITDIKDELRKEENWTDPIFSDIKKGNYYIITVTEQAIQNKNFITMLEKHNLQAKNTVYCYIRFGDGSKNWIQGRDAIRINNELEKNNKVLTIYPDYLMG
jgi:hypothetical protein